MSAQRAVLPVRGAGTDIFPVLSSLQSLCKTVMVAQYPINQVCLAVSLLRAVRWLYDNAGMMLREHGDVATGRGAECELYRRRQKGRSVLRQVHQLSLESATPT